MLNKEALSLFDNEILEVENNHIDHFKSKPSLTDNNEHLRLKDCIDVFRKFDLPPVGQRIEREPTYTIGFLESYLTKEIMTELQKKITLRINVLNF